MAVYGFKGNAIIVIDGAELPRMLNVREALDLLVKTCAEAPLIADEVVKRHADAAQLTEVLMFMGRIIDDILKANGDVANLPDFPGLGVAQPPQPTPEIKPSQPAPPRPRGPEPVNPSFPLGSQVTTAVRNQAVCWKCKKPWVRRPNGLVCPGECGTVIPLPS